MGKILAANHNMGSAMAMVPALKLLMERGHAVATFAAGNDVPAWKTFTNGGLDPRTIGRYLLLQGNTNPCMNSAIAHKVLCDEQPDVVLVGVSDNSSDGVERMLINEARDAGIPVAAIVESWPHNWLATFPEQIPTYQRADRLFVLDKLSRARAIQAGFESRRVVVTGNPGYDGLAALHGERENFRNEYRKRFGMNEKDPVVLFVWAVTQNLDEEPTEGHPEWLGFTETRLLAEFLGAVDEAWLINPGCRAVVRQKPYYGTKTALRLIDRKCPNLAYLDNEDVMMGRMPAVAADVVFGTTTLLLEIAALCGTLSLSYLPGRAETDTKFTNQIGVTLPLYTRGAVADTVLAIAENPETTIGKLKRQRMQSSDLPANATKNVADELEKFLG